MTFGEYLGELLGKYEISALTYAQSLGYKRNGFVSNVIKNNRTPPPKRIEAWAAKLPLDSNERARFLELARSARAKGKRDSADYIGELEARIDRAEQKLARSVGLLVVIFEIAHKKGVHFPEQIVKKVDILRKRR